MLPAGLTLTQASPSLGTFDGGTGVWDLGTLNAGVVATLPLSVTATAALAGRPAVFACQTSRADVNPANNIVRTVLGLAPPRAAGPASP